MRVLTVLILGLLSICYVNGSVIPDEALSASLREARYDDEFVIALSNIKGKRKSTSGSIETLLAVRQENSRSKIRFILDRRAKRVIFEGLDENGQRYDGHVNVNSLSENTPVKSLIVLVHQEQSNPHVDVYVDCTYEGSVSLHRFFRDVFQDESSATLEVLRERRCQANVYRTSTISEALKKEKCPDDLNKMKWQSHDESDESNENTSNHDDNLTLFSEENTKHSHHLKNKRRTDEHQSRPNNRDINNLRRTERRSPSDEYSPYKYISDPLARSEQSDNSDNFDYSDEPRTSPTHTTINLPLSESASEHRPRKPDSSGRPNYRSGSKPDRSDPYGTDNVSDDDLFFAPEHSRSLSGRTSNEPGISSRGRPDRYDYPNQTDMSRSGKRVPRRGDIGIQSLDEKVCLTDSQIVKTLNELINVTKRFWQELEQNRLETQHLRHLIENCAACRGE